MHVDYADGKVTGTISNSRHTRKAKDTAPESDWTMSASVWN